MKVITVVPKPFRAKKRKGAKQFRGWGSKPFPSGVDGVVELMGWLGLVEWGGDNRAPGVA